MQVMQFMQKLPQRGAGSLAGPEPARFMNHGKKGPAGRIHRKPFVHRHLRRIFTIFRDARYAVYSKTAPTGGEPTRSPNYPACQRTPAAATRTPDILRCASGPFYCTNLPKFSLGPRLCLGPPSAEAPPRVRPARRSLEANVPRRSLGASCHTTAAPDSTSDRRSRYPEGPLERGAAGPFMALCLLGPPFMAGNGGPGFLALRSPIHRAWHAALAVAPTG